MRPFTIDSRERLCFINANELLGFEVGDLTTGKVLHKVVVEGFERGPVKRHGCPSHGIGLTPDEHEVWLTDGHNQRLHIFDATQSPPRQVASIKLRDEPGWVTFSIAGDYAYPSTGEVIDPRTRQIVATLKDEQGAPYKARKCWRSTSWAASRYARATSLASAVPSMLQSLAEERFHRGVTPAILLDVAAIQR